MLDFVFLREIFIKLYSYLSFVKNYFKIIFIVHFFFEH